MSQAKNPSHSDRKPNRLINEQSPYLRQHAYNPVDWYAWGGSAGAREGREQADPAVDRLLGVSLVPRDGARIVRERSDRADDERELRLDQSRSRGAARPRPDLHGCGAADDRARRLAADDVPHAGRAAVFRRHLFSAGGSAGDARLPAHAGGGLAGVSREGQGRRQQCREAHGGARRDHQYVPTDGD